MNCSVRSARGAESMSRGSKMGWEDAGRSGGRDLLGVSNLLKWEAVCSFLEVVGGGVADI